MVQLIVHYIKDGSVMYYEEAEGYMGKVERLSKGESDIYEWYFYNEVAETSFLDGYIYDEIRGIPAESIVTMHENIYMKRSL